MGMAMPPDSTDDTSTTGNIYLVLPITARRIYRIAKKLKHVYHFALRSCPLPDRPPRVLGRPLPTPFTMAVYYRKQPLSRSGWLARVGREKRKGKA